MLPGDFAPWKTVCYYYRKWSSLGEIDLLLNDLSGKVRLRMGQNREAGLGIMDSRSVHWGDNRSPKGFDGNKKVKGIKASFSGRQKRLSIGRYGHWCRSSWRDGLLDSDPYIERFSFSGEGDPCRRRLSGQVCGKDQEGYGIQGGDSGERRQEKRF